ncbi:MAG TPA: hypothetical protein VMZ31_20110 [Phycisphaerae bacterium]|nr:hypothetical protein [Phycisphaerae bacterium]
MFSGQSFPALEYGNKIRNTKITAHLPGIVASNGAFEYRVMRSAYVRYQWATPAWNFSWADREALLAFWNQVGGKLLSFLWTDPDHNNFTAAALGTGTQIAVPAAPSVTADLKAGVIPLGTHEVTVTALNAEGETTPSAWTSVALALDPPAPTLAASTSAGTLAAGTYTYGLVFHTATGYSLLGTTAAITTTATGEVDLSWTLPPDVTSVDVYGRVSGGLALLASGLSGTTWTDTGAVGIGPAAPTLAASTAAGTLAAGTYTYALVAHTAAGHSLLGTTAALTTTATGQVIIDWSLPSYVTSVDVYGRVGGSLGLLASGITAGTWTDDGSVAVGAAAPTVATATLGTTAPTTATATGEITSTWAAVTGALSYNVYLDKALAGNTTALTFTDQGGATGGAAPTVNGTGITTFPLVVPVAGALHPIWHPNADLTIDAAGAPIGGWNVVIINQQPTVVFPAGACPLLGQAVTATGTFAFAVRFNNDFAYVLLNAVHPTWAPSSVDAMEMIEVFE